MAHTVDGRHWHSVPVPDAKVSTSCIDVPGCISHVRFANANIGYAYGPKALFMTRDGGQQWIQQPGGAYALEPAGGNVIRVLAKGSGCPGPCIDGIETAPTGAVQWSKAAFTKPTMTVTDLILTRSRSDAYLLVTANPAGGAQGETSVLYGSHDSGATWTNLGEPCPQGVGGAEVDSSTVTTAYDGTVVVGCVKRQPPHPVWVAESSDGGRTFHARPAFAKTFLDSIAAASASDLVAQAPDLYRSVDGGQHFTPVQGPQHTSWLGFETSTTGHAIEAPPRGSTHGSLYWTTRDGGQTWTSIQFP